MEVVRTRIKSIMVIMVTIVEIFFGVLLSPKIFAEKPKKTFEYLDKIDFEDLRRKNISTIITDSDFKQTVDMNYVNGYESEDEALEIKSSEDLFAFAKCVNEGKNFEGKFIKLKNDIDLNCTKVNRERILENFDKNGNSSYRLSFTVADDTIRCFTSIGTKKNPFKGTFDGNGHEIQNLTIISCENDLNIYSGLFGYVSCDVTIKNLRVRCIDIISFFNYAAGGLVGENAGRLTILNSCVIGNVTSFYGPTAYAGGLVGESSDMLTVSNSCVKGDIISYSDYYSYAGGIIGQSYNTDISKSYMEGEVKSSSIFSSYAGGISGEIYGTANISETYVEGNIVSFGIHSATIGGFTGECDDISIFDSYVEGTITSISDSGFVSYVGGLIGGSVEKGSTVKILNSYVEGDTNSFFDSYTGGLVGLVGGTLIISNSYVEGNVNSKSGYSTGGFIGGSMEQDITVIISNSYVKGVVNS